MRILPATLRYAFRRWRHRPGLAVTATLVLALGIGATTAMFSIVQAVVLKEEPWPDADRLVRVYAVEPRLRSNPAFATRWNRMPISWQSWRDLQNAPTFGDVAVWVPGQQVVGDERPELVQSFFASSTLPLLLRAKPAQGRFFNADEDEADTGTVIISHRLWTRMFGADPTVIGKQTTVTNPGEPGTAPRNRRTIIGVLPMGFSFPGDEVDLLLPIGFHKYNGSFGNKFFLAMGRLATGSGIDAATAAAEPLVRRDEPRDQRTGRVVGLKADRIGFGDQPLWLMLAGAALLLVVACSNVAGLLLSDARSRQHENAVRLALGGSRAAILRLIMAEHAFLAIAAGVGGVLLAWWLIPTLMALAPPGLMGNQTVALDRTLAGWSVLAAVVTTLLAGLIPAISMSATRPGDALKAGGREATQGGRWRHRVIVAAQFALALVLLVGAALFGETLLRLGSQDLGFRTDGVVVASISRARQAAKPLSAEESTMFLEARKEGGAGMSRFISQRSWMRFQPILDHVSTLPNVKAVAAADAVPFAGEMPASIRVTAEGRPPEESQTALSLSVSDSYFNVLGIPLLRGRLLEPGDRLTFDSVVISVELERRLFGGNGLGRRIARTKVPLTVVGVVADVKHRALAEIDLPTVYFPMIEATRARHLVVRAAGDLTPLVAGLRPTLEQHSDPMFVTMAAPLDELVASSIVVERGRAMLSAMYGGVALLLAAVGLYGLAARLVAERRREIGIRVALGAGRRDVRRLVMRDAWLIVGVGLVVGGPAAYAASKFAQGMLFGVTPAAPHVLGIAVLALIVASIAATMVPVWRANRIDPAVTLRQE